MLGKFVFVTKSVVEADVVVASLGNDSVGVTVAPVLSDSLPGNKSPHNRAKNSEPLVATSGKHAPCRHPVTPARIEASSSDWQPQDSAGREQPTAASAGATQKDYMRDGQHG